MNKPIFLIVAILFPILGCTKQESEGFKNPFFVFNNSMNKKEIAQISYADQAKLLKDMGYDGMEYKETENLLETIDLFGKQGLKIYTDYVRIDIDNVPAYLPEWKEVIPKLKGSGIILWLHIHSEKFAPSDEAADSIIIPILREMADFAKPYGVRLAVYHHVNFLAEKAEDSYRLAVKTNRENVGSVFNLVHFLKTNSEENLEKIIDLTLPKLFAVSISGADGGDTQNMEWDQLIQPLGQGTFEVYRFVELLAGKGYTGPIGLQCYNLKGQPEVYLKQSMEAWKSFNRKYVLPSNILSEQEKKEGWQLLFDGVTTANWRGINQDSFPESGWKIENGELIACAYGGAESGNGGDIVTRNKYSNFILKWEWNMKTRGGNSGLKYFVQEGLGENKKYGFGLEYQLLDDQKNERILKGMPTNDYHSVGSLYEIYPASPDKRPSPIGLWNESQIISKGSYVEHWLNGKKILEYDRGSDDFKEKIAASKFKNVPGYGMISEGLILLQDHGSIIHFRNIKIKVIENQLNQK